MQESVCEFTYGFAVGIYINYNRLYIIYVTNMPGIGDGGTGIRGAQRSSVSVPGPPEAQSKQ